MLKSLEENRDGIFMLTPEPLLKNQSCNYGHVQVAQIQRKSPQSHAKYKASHTVNIVLKVLNHAARHASKLTSRLIWVSAHGQ